MISPILPHSLSAFFPTGVAPKFIQPAHDGDNHYSPEASDFDLSQILPALPERDAAREAGAWDGWKNWQLATALLPERDTVNGEYFDIADITPCVGECHTKTLTHHAQKLYPHWCGRYRFRLVHVLRLIKSYQANGAKKHARADLIRLVGEKFFGVD